MRAACVCFNAAGLRGDLLCEKEPLRSHTFLAEGRIIIQNAASMRQRVQLYSDLLSDAARNDTQLSIYP
jgi:hypothetical protein